MKISGLMAVTVVAAALALQGCAGGGDIKYASGAQPSTAPQNAPSPAVTAVNTKDDFEAVQAAVKQQMQPGKRWGYIDPTDRGSVDQRFADMQALFDKYGTVDKMDGLAKTRLLDDQNAINEALARNDGNRLICQRVAPTGSHITKTVCMTLSEMRLREQNDKFNVNRQRLQGMNQQVGGGG